MASDPIAIPIPPATAIQPPTPSFSSSLGMDALDDEHNLDSAALSPLDGLSPSPQPLSPTSPTDRRNSTPTTPIGLNVSPSSSSPAAVSRRGSQNPSPFNFQPMVAAKSPVAGKPLNQRRGHKYKHSSVSHQIFLEPPLRAPLALPASLPIPTWRELYGSISMDQRTRSVWCCCHLLVAAFTLYSAQGSLALTALSHLILFDALGASLCVSVDVLSNFEVWKRSSIRHPFGLERAEVLAGFAMSVFLLFMGFDIISHTSEHLVEGWYEDDGHGHHGSHEEHVVHARVSPGSVDLASLAALLSTLVSAVLLKNHARIGRAMRFAYLSSLPSILSNPSHLLTIICSFILLLIPLMSLPHSAMLDRALALSMALAMIVIGVRLVKVLGGMLLMSFGGAGVGDVISEISSDTAVKEVLDARFWQVHHGLCIATMTLVVNSVGESGEAKIRERVVRIVRDRLGGGYGKGMEVQRWEVSVALAVG